MDFTLNILGTASALPTINRYPSAQVLDVHGRLFLFDCGEGAQMQMRRMGLSYLKVDVFCLSHIHGDHLFGLFGLLSTMGMLGRKSPLQIFAPRSFGPILKFFLSYFGEGLQFRIEYHPLSMKSPEKVYETKSVELSAFPLRHRIETYGFLLREKEPLRNVRKDCIEKYSLGIAEMARLKNGEDIVRSDGTVISNGDVTYRPYDPRSYAYCSDTAPFPELASWVHGVDLLYHEATFTVPMEETAAATFHSTAAKAAECAAEAQVKKLVVGHYSSRYRDLQPFMDEILPIFSKVVLAHEGDVIEVPLRRYLG